MELKSKLYAAEQFLRLGMDVYKSLLAAECTADEIEELMAENSDFMKKAEWVQAKQVADLLEDVKKAKDINIPRGISTEARWLLGKVDSTRFGEGIKLNGTSDKKKFSITFAVENSEDDSNVEVNDAGNSDSGPDSHNAV